MTDSSDFNQTDSPQEDLELDEPQAGAEGQDATIPLIWRIVAVVVAAVVILALLWPTLGRRLAPTSGAPTPAPPATASDSSGAMATLQAGVEADPQSVEALFKLGNGYAAEGQWRAAVEAYEQVLDLDPNYLDAYANLGVAYYQLQDLNNAAQAYQKALAINPDDADVTYNLGALYLQQALTTGGAPDQEQIQRAIDQFNRALALNADLVPPHFSLGVAYMTLGETAQAIAEFEQFQALDDGQDRQATDLAAQYLTQLRGAGNQ